MKEACLVIWWEAPWYFIFNTNLTRRTLEFLLNFHFLCLSKYLIGEKGESTCRWKVNRGWDDVWFYFTNIEVYYSMLGVLLWYVIFLEVNYLFYIYFLFINHFHFCSFILLPLSLWYCSLSRDCYKMCPRLLSLNSTLEVHRVWISIHQVSDDALPIFSVKRPGLRLCWMLRTWWWCINLIGSVSSHMCSLCIAASRTKTDPSVTM